MKGTKRADSLAVASLAASIRAEVEGLVDAWTLAGISQVGSPEFTAYITTLSALNHVQQALSPGRYWTLEARREAPSRVDECLRQGAGICGNQQRAMVDVMRFLGYAARPIGLYFKDAFGTRSSHATVEVAWGGAWHYVDVTNGAVFRKQGAPGPDLLSITDLLRESDPRALAIVHSSKAELQLTTEFVGDPLDYLAADLLDVVIDDQGAVRIKGAPNGETVGFSLVGVPNYVGVTATSAGGRGSMRLILCADRPIGALELAISAVAATELTICLEAPGERWECVVRPGDRSASLPARTSATQLVLSAHPPAGEIGYVLMDAIRASRLRGRRSGRR